MKPQKPTNQIADNELKKNLFTILVDIANNPNMNEENSIIQYALDDILLLIKADRAQTVKAALEHIDKAGAEAASVYGATDSEVVIAYETAIANEKKRYEQ